MVTSFYPAMGTFALQPGPAPPSTEPSARLCCRLVAGVSASDLSN